MLRRHIAASALAVLAFGVLTPRETRAHFALQSPPSWMSQDSLGSPQKLGPCGDEAGGTATGVVTAFQAGQTITVTIDEKVFHPGHYRIALSVNDRSELPAEPVVTPGTNTPCGTAAIETPPVFPVLADDVFDHTAPFSTPQSIQVTLPSNVTCTHCTLQVIEFMSNHALNNPGGCFYHHCADISLQTTPVVDAGPAADAGGADGSATADAGGVDGGAGNPTEGGCSCTVATTRTPAAGGLAVALGLTLLARRRRSRRAGAAGRSAGSAARTR
jgi:MYXO-CTERM domain-containing protein